MKGLFRYDIGFLQILKRITTYGGQSESYKDPDDDDEWKFPDTIPPPLTPPSTSCQAVGGYQTKLSVVAFILLASHPSTSSFFFLWIRNDTAAFFVLFCAMFSSGHIDYTCSSYNHSFSILFIYLKKPFLMLLILLMFVEVNTNSPSDVKFGFDLSIWHFVYLCSVFHEVTSKRLDRDS